jgi:hypothetical protein
MNPLKMYMYQMLGLPIVSTEVDNMTGANGMLQVARTHDEFLRRLTKIGAGTTRRSGGRAPFASNVYWDDNVASMIQIASESLKRSGSAYQYKSA